MKRLLLLLACFLVLCSCSKKIEPVSTDKPTHTENKLQVVKQPSKSIIDELYVKNENIVFSDVSLNMALAMLANGASDETLNQLESYLGDNIDELNNKYRNLLDSYGLIQKSFEERVKKCEEEKENGQESTETRELLQLNMTCPALDEYSLEIANGIFVSDALTIKNEFSNSLKTVYKAIVENVDYTDSVGAAKKINRFVKEGTHEVFDEIVSPDDIKGANSVLINTIYFLDTWLDEFGQYEESEDFINADGTKSSVKYLHSKENVYFENDNATAFMKEYSNGLYFIGVLPKKEGDFNFSELNVRNLIEKPEYGYDVKVKMPEYKIESTLSLNEALASLGLSEIFSDNAKLDKMFENSNQKADAIIQKAKIDVNKEGTEAVAVTAVITMGTTASASPQEPEIKEIYLTRPFGFAIYDAQNDVILFSGKVVHID